MQVDGYPLLFSRIQLVYSIKIISRKVFQLVETSSDKRVVEGSIPSFSTINLKNN
jgi:hypothetical protein